MHKSAFLAPLAATVAIAGVAFAQPASQPAVGPADISVTIGGDLLDEVEKLGARDVQLQADALARVVRRELDRSGALPGAQVRLVLTDLKPNRPTYQQVSDRPGLSMFHSISIGGAAIEGEVVTADGQTLPVSYSRYSHSILDVQGAGTWQDAGRAFSTLASNLSSGRLVQR